MAFLDRYTKSIGSVRKKSEEIRTNLPSVRTVYRDGKRVEEVMEDQPHTSLRSSESDYDLTPSQVEKMRRKAALKESKSKKSKKPKRVVVHRNKVD